MVPSSPLAVLTPSGPLLWVVTVLVRTWGGGAQEPLGYSRKQRRVDHQGRVGSGREGCGTSGKSRRLWGGVPPRPALRGGGGKVRSCCWQASWHLACRVRSQREAAAGWARQGGHRSGPCLPGPGGPGAGWGLARGTQRPPRQLRGWAGHAMTSLFLERGPLLAAPTSHPEPSSRAPPPGSPSVLGWPIVECPIKRSGEQDGSVPRKAWTLSAAWGDQGLGAKPCSGGSCRVSSLHPSQ